MASGIVGTSASNTSECKTFLIAANEKFHGGDVVVRATYQPAVGEFAASHGTQAFEWRAIRLASRIATVTIPRVAYHTIAPGEILVRGGASLRVCDDGPYSADPYLTGLATLTGLSTADYGWNLSHTRANSVRLP